MILETIVGIGTICFLLIYFAFQWDRKEHYLLQLLISLFFVFLLLLIPKVLVDNPDTCQIVTLTANETVGNTTYSYGEFCITNTKTTHTIFYASILWFLRTFTLYLFLYFNYVFWLKSKLLNFKLMRGNDGTGKNVGRP